MNTHADFYFYRSSSGVEVDLIVDRRSYKEAIEIKSGSSFSSKMIKPIESILEAGDKAYLLYDGEAFTYKAPFNIINYRDYLQATPP